MTEPFAPALEPTARRCYLTILFADLSGSAALAAALETEHYAGMLAGVRALYRDVVAKHGGTVVRVQGDGLLAIFGHPEVREDDGRRAAEAALELHDAVRALRFDAGHAPQAALSLHSGIDTGWVLVEEGDMMRGRFELLGNPPNIAARLSAAAAADEILVSESTLGPESPFFQTSERLRLDVKGVGTVPAYRILARSRPLNRLDARARRGLAPFVGRSEQLEQLDLALREALAGHPCCVVVSAAPGIGKTRLVEHFLAGVTPSRCHLHRGWCDGSLGAEPLQPFLQMLRATFGLDDFGAPAAGMTQDVERALSGIHPRLLAYRDVYLHALSIGGDARASPLATAAALRELFAALAASKPLIMFVDDWQWADDASRQVMAALRTLDASPILVLITTRGPASGSAELPPGARAIELAPFSDEEARQTMTQLLPGTDPFLIGEVLGYSGGNALFIEELCHCLAHGETRLRQGRAHDAAWLDALVESRVQRLPPEQAELVRTAAVIGNVIPTWLLQAITGRGEDDPLVQGLAQQDFVFPGERPGTLRFKHGITRDVIYEAVGLHERRAMHCRIAESLQRAGAEDEALETLAYHYGAGGQAGEAAHYAELAGDKAVAASALDRAKNQYCAALAALDRLGAEVPVQKRWIAITERLGLACVFDASRDELPVFRRAVDIAAELGDAGASARAQYWLAYIEYALGEMREALRHGELALAAARAAGDDPLVVQIRAALGQMHAAACHYDDAERLLDEAIEIKRRHLSGAKRAVGLAYSLACKAHVLADRGSFVRAQLVIDEALALVRGLPHQAQGSIIGWRGTLLLWQGRWEEAREAAAEAYRISQQVRSLFALSMARAIEGYASWMLEPRPEALAAITDATAWLGPRESRLFSSLNRGWLTDALTSAGRFGEARRQAALALCRARKGDLLGIAMAYRALARIDAAEHDAPGMRRHLDLAMKVAVARGSAHEIAVTRLCDAQLALSHGGDRRRAGELIDNAAASFEAMDMRWHLQEARRLRREPH